jgi:hypothetical protein
MLIGFSGCFPEQTGFPAAVSNENYLLSVGARLA